MKLKAIGALLVSVLCLFSPIVVTAQMKPDFAYPKTVISDSKEALESAIKKGDDKAVVRNVINIILAENVISPDSTKASLELLNATIPMLAKKGNEVAVGLLQLVEARYLEATYLSERHIYNERTLPEGQVPEDPAQWDGAIFKKKISDCLSQALSHRDALAKAQLKDWKSVIKQDKFTDIYYPTLYDFVAQQATDIYNNIGVLDKSKEILESLVKINANRPAPRIQAEIGLIVLGDSKDKGAMLWALYDKYADETEYSGDVLLQDLGDSDRLWKAVNANLKKYKSFPKNDDLKNILARLSKQDLQVRFPKVVLPGEKAQLELTIKNAATGQVFIYEVDEATAIKASNTRFAPGTHNKQVGVIPYSLSDSIPFEKKIKVEYAFPKVGAYIVVPVIGDEQPSEKQYSNIIYVSDLGLAVNNVNGGEALALTLDDGKPVEGATIYNTYREKSSVIGSTNKKGRFNLDSSRVKERGLQLTAVKDGSVSIPLYSSRWEQEKKRVVPAGNIYTDLPLYHPGDTLQFAVVAYEYGVGLSRVLKERHLNVSFFDVNFDLIAKQDVLTDAYGRASGKFAVPADRLTGRYSLRLTDEETGDIISYEMVNVSDYKLPTYALTIDNVEVTLQKDAIVRGQAMGYNGMPVSNAKVDLGVRCMPRFCWYFPNTNTKPFYTDSIDTDAQGRFEVKIPNSVFAESEYPDGLFQVNVKTVSPSGEAREGSNCFMLKAAYQLAVDVSEVVDVKDGFALKAEAADYAGKRVSIPLKYKLELDSLNVIEGTMTSGETKNLNLKPGRWELTVSGVNPDECQEDNVTFVAWNSMSNTSPVDDVLWTPEKYLVVEANKVSVPVFASKKTHIIYTLSTDKDGVVEERTIHVEPGRTTLELTLPNGTENAQLNLLAVADKKLSVLDINLTDKRLQKSLEVTAETFRDKINPTGKETVTLRFKPKNAKLPAAAMLRVFNKAVYALAHSSWSLNTLTMTNEDFSWNVSQVEGNTSQSICSQVKYLKGITIEDPSFETYDKEWRMPSRMMFNDFMVLESAAAPTRSMKKSAKIASNDMGKGAMVEEQIELGSGDESEAEEQAQEPENDEVQLRDSEVPLAYFAPTLVSKPDGTLQVTFEVPNANATWLFQAVGWTCDPVVTARWSAEAIAAKPVMVQPNLPRFLRVGDVAVVRNTVYNNTDKAQAVTVDVEIFNPQTEALLTTYTTTQTVPAGQSVVVPSTIDTRGTDFKQLTAIGYRVKARGADGFTDGEQSILPIHEAVGQVAESKPFWIAPSTRLYEQAIEGNGSADRQVSVTVNENPVASVLSALPGMMNTPVVSSCSAAPSIFSVAVAQKLLADNPTLLLHGSPEWTLDRGKLLKTPFLQDAKDDARRAELLNLLATDKGQSEASKIFTDAVKMLKTLERGDGGWAWIPCMDKMSLWATMNNLALLGRMRQLGADAQLDNGLRKDLSDMISRAVKAMDREVYEQYKKYPESNFITYTMTRDFWSDIYPPSMDADKVMSATVQQILGRWKDLDSPQKAMCAQILENHSYRNVAKDVLNSLEEYSESSPEKGMWWPMIIHRNSPVSVIGSTSIILDAWYAIDAVAPQVDAIRQWMILQKRTQDWGTSATTTDAIASILTTSERWMKAPDNDATQVSLADNKLTIQRVGNSDVPLFGAVTTVYTPAPGQKVAAAPCEGIISIEKQVLRLNPDGTTSEGPVKVGDKIRVLLMLDVKQAVDYVVIRDNRSACLEPVDQLSSRQFMQGVSFYRENRDDATVLCFNSLPVGTYQITYDVYANNAGTYTMPPAVLESEYAPEVVAHSNAGGLLEVK